MNVELKKVKYHESMSDETNCFEAEIWVDGKKLADVQNHGQGGENEYHPVGGYSNPGWYSFLEYCKAQPHEYDFELTDQYVDTLFSKWLEKDNERRAQTQVKRWCKNQTVYRLKGDEPGTWRTVKHVYDAKVKEFMVGKYGDKVEEIANERFVTA
jgi:hypothetical protein